MSLKDERRRHQRYPLKLSVTLHRGSEELAADIINASEGGCLLLVSFPLETGEVLEASIPQLMIPRTKLHVLRCQSLAEGEYSVATCFEAPMGNASTVARLSSEQQQAEPQQAEPQQAEPQQAPPPKDRLPH
jgi:hypothetical protein